MSFSKGPPVQLYVTSVCPFACFYGLYRVHISVGSSFWDQENLFESGPVNGDVGTWSARVCSGQNFQNVNTSLQTAPSPLGGKKRTQPVE